MMGQNPSLGRIVVYTLTEDDALAITRRRRGGREEGTAVASINMVVGNPVHAGDEFPMTITSVAPDASINGQVWLDGSDTFWAQGVIAGVGGGTWRWPDEHRRTSTARAER